MVLQARLSSLDFLIEEVYIDLLSFLIVRSSTSHGELLVVGHLSAEILWGNGSKENYDSGQVLSIEGKRPGHSELTGRHNFWL
jgi:hypothetical protein